MRITEFDLEIEDLEWYAVDDNDNIAQFTSGGIGGVPEFICESREDLDIICEYFNNLNINIAEAELIDRLIKKSVTQSYVKECKNMAQKGIYCYDAFDDQESMQGYQIISKPNKGLYLSDLPEQIQKILVRYRINDVYFSKNEFIRVNAAY